MRTKGLLKKRIYSFVCDLFIISVINRAVIDTFLSYQKTFFPTFNHPIREKIYGMAFGLSSVTLSIIFVGYFIFSYYMSNGETIGKHFFKIKLAQVDSTEHLRLTQITNRVMSYFFCSFFMFLPFIISFLRSDGRGIPDFVSGTKIIASPSDTSQESTSSKKEDNLVCLVEYKNKKTDKSA
jgi:uncharacterized RDD family membrane protein YckC